jgi:hypothetical protein
MKQGFVLLTTLILLALLALLVLSELQLLLLDSKALTLMKKKHQSFLALEAAANHLAFHTDLSNLSCLYNEQDSKTIHELLLRGKGCHLVHENQRYYFIIADRGLFPCLLGISIRASDKQGILELGLARLVKGYDCEKRRPRQGKIGLLSWRYYL